MYWVKLLHRLQKRIRPQSFNNWFKPTHQIFEDDERVVILIPSTFFRDVIERSYADILRECAAEEGLLQKRLEFVTSDEWDARQSPGGAAGASHPGLNPLYTFENFVEGSGNSQAYAACRAVGDHPGVMYNPLFIYGGVGLGKTHLLHAIGNFVYQQSPQSTVTYVSCDALMNHLVEAYRTGSVHEMRKYYRSADILLLDDVHTLSGKERTQEELFSLFNILHQANKQIVLAADQPPSRLVNIEKRLISRFSWGLVVDIQPPELEVRIAILKKKAQLQGLDLPDSVALYIAERITGNVRLLEGSLKSLIFHASMKSEPITLELAKRALAPLAASPDAEDFSGVPGLPNTHLTIDDLARLVCNLLNVPMDDLRSSSHRPKVVLPRQIVMYLARRLLQASLTDIGRYFHKHHTTVMYSIDKISELIDENKQFKKQIDEIVEFIHKKGKSSHGLPNYP